MASSRVRSDLFTPGGGPLTFPLTGAPRAQNPGRQRGKFFDPFLTLFGGAPKGRPERVSAHPLTGADFYPPGGGVSAHLSAHPIANPLRGRGCHTSPLPQPGFPAYEAKQAVLNTKLKPRGKKLTKCTTTAGNEYGLTYVLYAIIRL